MDFYSIYSGFECRPVHQTLWHFCLALHSAYQQTLGYYPGWAVTTYFLKTPICSFVFLPPRLYNLICPQHNKLNRKFLHRWPAMFFLGKFVVRMVNTVPCFDETHCGTVLSQLIPVHTSISKLHAFHFSVSPTCVCTLIFRMGGSFEFCLYVLQVMHLWFPSYSVLNTDVMKVIGKGKDPVHIVHAYRGSWGIAPRILTLHYMNWIGELHTPTDLPPGKNPRYPFCRKLGEPKSRFGRFGEEANILPLPGIWPRIVQLTQVTFWRPFYYYFAKFVGSRYSWCVYHSGG